MFSYPFDQLISDQPDPNLTKIWLITTKEKIREIRISIQIAEREKVFEIVGLLTKMKRAELIDPKID